MGWLDSKLQTSLLSHGRSSKSGQRAGYSKSHKTWSTTFQTYREISDGAKDHRGIKSSRPNMVGGLVEHTVGLRIDRRVAHKYIDGREMQSTLHFWWLELK